MCPDLRGAFSDQSLRWGRQLRAAYLAGWEDGGVLLPTGPEEFRARMVSPYPVRELYERLWEVQESSPSGLRIADVEVALRAAVDVALWGGMPQRGRGRGPDVLAYIDGVLARIEGR